MVIHMQTIIKIMKDILTEKDGVSFCPVSFLALAGAAAMIGEFIYKGSVDFQGLGIGLAAIGAAKAAKSATEKDPEQQ